MSDTSKLRELPPVHEVVERLGTHGGRFPRQLVVSETRRVIEQMRAEILAGTANGNSVESRVIGALDNLACPSLRRVINATGVVLHTNLGRAPLPPVSIPGSYSNLEYDLVAGRRGKRDTHIAGLLERLLGAPGIAVNNNAAAVFLTLNELASGGEVVVSRGELVEIGDGFRIPDIMARSGAILREVGTTNRTHLGDYREAISERTRLLMRVHRSNFRIEGFTSTVGLDELAALGRERRLSVYEDLGSGCVADLRPFGVDEPLVGESLRAGVDLVSFSGDKLMGGPQAGILAGKPELVQRLRRNPLFRALRLDKLIYQVLETTLRDLLFERWDRIPALAMIRLQSEAIFQRTEGLLKRWPNLRAEIVPGASVIGGGSTPQQELPTWLLALHSKDPVTMERLLRSGTPSVIARIEEGRVVLDLRTVLPAEEDELAAAVLKWSA